MICPACGAEVAPKKQGDQMRNFCSDSCRNLFNIQLRRIGAWLYKSGQIDAQAVMAFKTGETPLSVPCTAIQMSDQMVCKLCNIAWDMNDPSPPVCLGKYKRK